MYINPYYQPLYMMRQEASYIRVLHASPGASGVDVYANGNLIARNLRYRNFTPYLKVTPGAYNIRVYRFGTTTNPIVSTNVTLNPGAIYTAAAIGRPVNIGLFLISDTRVPVSQSRANVRFIHLSPDSPALDITLPDGRILFSNVGYRGVTNYIPLNPGRYTIQARLAGTNNVILRVPNIVIRPGLNLSIYAVGLSKGTPKLQVLIPLDGSTYLPV